MTCGRWARDSTGCWRSGLPRVFGTASADDAKAWSLFYAPSYDGRPLEMTGKLILSEVEPSTGGMVGREVLVMQTTGNGAAAKGLYLFGPSPAEPQRLWRSSLISRFERLARPRRDEVFLAPRPNGAGKTTLNINPSVVLLTSREHTPGRGAGRDSDGLLAGESRPGGGGVRDRVRRRAGGGVCGGFPSGPESPPRRRGAEDR